MTIKTIILSGALVLGTTFAHAQVTDPARPDQGNAQTQAGPSTIAPAPGGVTPMPRAGANDPIHEPSRPDRGNTARSMDAPAPAGVAPMPRAGAAGGPSEPSRPDIGNSQTAPGAASPAGAPGATTRN